MNNSYNELWHSHENSWFKTEQFSPDFNSGEYLLIKPAYSLVSLGTEKLVISSKIHLSTEERMRVPYMKGTFQDTFTYGYSLVGEVIEGPGSYMGNHVHLLHPHQDLAMVHVEDAFIIPDEVSLRASTLASNMETAVNAIWDSKITLGDNVLIVGYGIIGALAALIAKDFPGVSVKILEINKARAQKAKSHGHDGLQVAIDSVRAEGKVVELSWYGSRKIEVNFGDSFHYGRKKIISSQVGSIPSHKLNNWDFVKRKKLVFDLLSKYQPDYLIDKEIAYEDAPEFFNELRNNTTDNIGVIIKYKR
jgi:threonine dehydrogenase-like Zn-dependent dehydrogenase